MSIPIEDVIAVLRDNGHLTDPKALQAVAKDLNAVEQEVKAHKVTGPKSKTRLVALVRGDAALQAALNGGAYILSVPDDDTTNTYSASGLLDRLRKAAAVHNDAPTKRRSKKRVKVETWNDLFHHVKAKTFKESGSTIGVKGKGNPFEVVVLTKETLT